MNQVVLQKKFPNSGSRPAIGRGPVVYDDAPISEDQPFTYSITYNSDPPHLYIFTLIPNVSLNRAAEIYSSGDLVLHCPKCCADDDDRVSPYSLCYATELSRQRNYHPTDAILVKYSHEHITLRWGGEVQLVYEIQEEGDIYLACHHCRYRMVLDWTWVWADLMTQEQPSLTFAEQLCLLI